MADNKKIREFLGEIGTIEAKVVDEVMVLADKYEIDKNKALNAFAAVLVNFVELADVSDYEGSK